MSYQLAPAEILLQIFEHLPRNDDLTCAMVCRAWCIPALQKYYQHAILSGQKNKEKWLSLAKQSYSTTSTMQHQQHQILDVGGLVKSLTITDFDMPAIHLGKYEFLDILSFIPYVKKITIKKPSHYNNNSDALFRYLRERERMLAGYWYESELFLEYLGLETNFHWGQNTEEIDYSANTSTEMHSYFKCQYNFRKSLKVLRIRNPEDVYYWSRSEKKHVNALTALQDFKCLTHIHLVNEIGGYQNTINPGGGEGLNIFFSALQSCPNLISIYLNDKNIAKQPTLTAFNNLLQQQQDKTRSGSKLQVVELWVPDLSTFWIKSMLWHFPLTGLKKLDLHITSIHFSKCIETINLDLLTQSGNYLGMHVDNAKISFSRESSLAAVGTGQMVHHSVEVDNKLSTSVLSRFGLFMDLLLNDNNTRDVRLYISRVGSLNDGEPDLVIQKTPNKFVVWYDTGCYADVFERLEEIYAMFYTEKRRSSLTTKKNLLSITIFWVEGYSISIGHCVFMLQSMLAYHTPPPSYVDQIIFSKPKQRGYQFSVEGSQQQENEDSRIEFRFDDSNHTISTYKSLENVTIRNLHRLEVSSLKYLAEQHKYIQSLKIITCSLQQGDYGNNEEGQQKAFIMNFTNFVRLQKFVLDVAFLNGRNCWTILLRKNGEQQQEETHIGVYHLAGQDGSIPYKAVVHSRATKASIIEPEGTNSDTVKLVILCREDNIDELVLCYKKESRVIATFTL